MNIEKLKQDFIYIYLYFFVKLCLKFIYSLLVEEKF